MLSAPTALPTASPSVAPAEPRLAAGGAAFAEKSGAQLRRGKRRDKRRPPNPAPLWSLYPIDPLRGETPAPPAIDEADPLEQAPRAAPGGAVPVPPEDTSQQGPLPLAIAGAAAVVLVAGVGWVLARRWAPAPAVAMAPSPGAPRSSPPAAEPAARAPEGDAPVAVREEHVRVHLCDGRSIEGWRRGAAVSEQGVIVVDVDEVYDATGTKVARSPLDSFLLQAHIERVEMLDEPAAKPREDARG